jgi:hypothetical protein
VVLALLGLGVWAVRTALAGRGDPGRRELADRDRLRVARAVAAARWAPAHDEADGRTRVLLRKTYTGLDGMPVVLEERVLEAFASDDPAWEARFTEAMARARFRCGYLNSEDAGGTAG